MEKDSALYQLMDARMNGVMNGIVKGDGEYQAIIRKSDEYSGRLDGMPLSQEVRLLIDRYVSEQNAYCQYLQDSATAQKFPKPIALFILPVSANLLYNHFHYIRHDKNA